MDQPIRPFQTGQVVLYVGRANDLARFLSSLLAASRGSDCEQDLAISCAAWLEDIEKSVELERQDARAYRQDHNISS